MKMQHLNWSIIPTLALEKIFAYSDLAERYECSLVSRHWYLTYLNCTKLSSCLDLNITYSPQLINLKSLIERYMQRFGKCIKSVRVSISSTDLTDLGKYLLNFSLVSLFNSLYAQNQQLLELELVNIKMTSLPQFITSDIEMLHVLKQFLKTQKQLKVFSIRDSSLPDEILIALAECTLENCHSTIETLKLYQVFEKEETWQSSAFKSLFQRLKSLKTLEIDYHYLKRDVIMKLVQGSPRLTHLKLYIRSFASKSELSNNTSELRNTVNYYNKHRLSAKTWKYLYLKHPNVQISFSYEDCGIYFLNLFQTTITNKLRLQHLFINWAYIRTNYFQKHFSLISTKFSHTLRTFQISLFIRSIFDAQCLFDFVDTSAKQIEIVQFKFDTDDLCIIEYCLQKFKSIIYNYKYGDTYLECLTKFHLILDISSINEAEMLEFQKIFNRVNFNTHSKFYLKSKFFITISNFSAKDEYSIKASGERL